MAVHPLRPATDRRLGEPLPHQLANQTRDHLSAHKALVIKGCPQITLCGISSRFQLLSPTERQVSHALLTRSPLSCPRRNNPVRLACVRHAASVRPEPGSNSQKIVSKLPKELKSKFWINLSSKYYSRIFVGCYNFVLYTILKQSINCPRCYSLSCIIQFTRYKLASRSRGQLCYISTLNFICQELFSSFFKFLFKFAFFAALADSFWILTQFKSFVKNFFQVFSNSFQIALFLLPLRTASIY